MNKLFIFFSILFFQLFLSQKSEIKYIKYENEIFSFELPSEIWGIPSQKLIENFKTNEKKISLENKIVYKDFDFLISYKNNEDFSQLYTPLIKITTGKANKNSFEKMKKEFGTDYIEGNFSIDNRKSSYNLKPVIDSKNRTIILSTHVDGIYGLSKLFFSDNYIVQFTYSDFEKDQCIECLVIYINCLEKKFKFK
ncbi:hypothetical protein [Cloacibacterium caeni]|uniref:hypothetical protein n=1 Tax=Cloacibacterium caeni TaxID=2004710 RepID=UPI001BCB01CC|nr:hypothetical protein [Cloacibacterium caeni]